MGAPIAVQELHSKKTVRALTLHARRAPWQRLDVLPFACLYVIPIAYYHGHAGDHGVVEAAAAIRFRQTLALGALALLLLAHVLVFLMQHWSKAFRCAVGYTPAASVRTATHVFAVPLPHCGSPAICPITAKKTREALPTTPGPAPGAAVTATAASSAPTFEYSFLFQRLVYIYNDALPVGPNGTFVPGFGRLEYPSAHPLSYYTAGARARGINSARAYAHAHGYFGPNTIEMPVPRFLDLFTEHLMAPFFVFQVFCVVLWMMDEYWYYALFTLAMLLVFECTVCYTRLRSMAQLRGQKREGPDVLVFRGGAWSKAPVPSASLVPGDIIAITAGGGFSSSSSSSSSSPAAKRAAGTCPCDVVLLSGTAVVNEAMLTGESVPKLKEPLSAADNRSSNNNGRGDSSVVCLSFTDGTDKRHLKNVLFCGTQVVKLGQPAARTGGGAGGADGGGGIPPAPNGGCTCFVVRTGFGTTQGDLMRTILFATERVTVGDAETLLFILVLLVFAVVASAYVLHEGLKDPAASRWKLFLHCTMICTSVVPPELPMELSLAVTNSIAALRDRLIYCVEPFRIPFAGKVDVCCFDKTGTLTSDQFRVVGVALGKGAVAGAGKGDGVGDGEGRAPASASGIVTDLSQLDSHARRVLAACNSIIWLNGRMAGDPMEVATVESLGWTVRADRAVPSVPSSSSNDAPIHVVRRLGFSSALKRMSVVVRVQERQQNATYVLTKGAPETVARLLRKGAVDPTVFNAAQRRYATTGKRVLALAYKRLADGASVSDGRSDLESELEFAGLLVLDSPLKPQSKPAVAQLLRSSHRVVIITGDNALTACSVASQLKIFTRAQAKQLVLMTLEADGSAAGTGGGHNGVAWFPVSGVVGATESALPFQDSDAHIESLARDYDLCATGNALAQLAKMYGGEVDSEAGDRDAPVAAAAAAANAPGAYVEPEVPLRLMRPLAANVLVFARTAPVQKERVLTALNSMGLTTLMCGDGTNDVGALKQAHVGISIINDVDMDKRAEKKSKLAKKMLKEKKKKAGSGSANAHQQLLLRLREMEVEQDQASRLVQLGDASVASAFTSKTASIACALDVIRQGRCTLVTTLQMYKILAVNCLLGAYSLSTLYLHGVKQGDTQMTVVGLGVAMFFFFVSRSKPLPELATLRPPSRVFSPFVLVSVAGQFVVHFLCLATALHLCEPHVDPADPAMLQDGDFRANVINTVVFLVSLIMQVRLVHHLVIFVYPIFVFWVFLPVSP